MNDSQSIVSQLVSQPLSVHIHHPVLQPSLPNPCMENHCDHLCLLSPSAPKGYVCKCRPGFRLVDEAECRESENPYLIVVKKNQIVDISSSPEDDANRGHITPIVGLKVGQSVDYDAKEQIIYWVEMANKGDNNGTLYFSHIGGGDKINFFDEFDTGMIGSPYAIAFDWVGRNLYIANQEAAQIELVRVDGKRKKRTVVLTNDGTELGVGRPVAIAVDPQNGKLYWLDRGGQKVPPKIGKANMDGSDPQILLQGNLTEPEFLTIDPDTEKIYFSHSNEAKVSSVTLQSTIGNRHP